MRTKYVIPLQGQIVSRIDQLEGDILKATNTSHRRKLLQKQDSLKKQQAELGTFDEKLRHADDQQISLDLDDGVRVNYAKFGDLLAEAKTIRGGEGHRIERPAPSQCGVGTPLQRKRDSASCFGTIPIESFQHTLPFILLEGVTTATAR